MMEIKSKKEEKLLERTEIIATTAADKPPARPAVQQSLSDALKIDKNLIVVKKIATHFGKREFTITAHVYKTEAKLKEVESPAALNKGKKKDTAAENKE
ncbi:MAG: hypothetical protein Q8O89_04045 [Nanoarchaeota archaeon]|nr:hypothetical protein [Nanoarchaeota archaeon]